jgi:hypothetical protein
MAPSFSSGDEALIRPIGKEVCEVFISDDFLEKKNHGLVLTYAKLYG